mmetsp:Transcript_15169/g.30703  ORF Transcript_15169/g.30703 Transcript_15169/m.30703 type:complete len:118 (-) Transcript_15169:565-918(-)
MHRIVCTAASRNSPTMSAAQVGNADIRRLLALVSGSIVGFGDSGRLSPSRHKNWPEHGSRQRQNEARDSQVPTMESEENMLKTILLIDVCGRACARTCALGSWKNLHKGRTQERILP